MTSSERRTEIMRLLTYRRKCTMGRLALELEASIRTIRRDILILTADYPLETTKGNGGCVWLPDWYHPHKSFLSKEQQTVLSQLMETANEQQREVLRQMLAEYGSPKARQMMNGGKNA